MTPIAGKLGRFETIVTGPTTTDHEFSDWMLGLNADILEADGFEKAADGDGNYWGTGMTGLCHGDAHVKGLWNTAKKPTTSIKPGAAITYTSVKFGLNLATVYFDVPILTKGIRVTQAVKDKAIFEADIFVNGAPTYP